MPSPETAQVLHDLASALKGELGLAGRPIAAERLHVTLQPLARAASGEALAPYVRRAVDR